MKLLILGGTVFLGRHLVAAAVAHHHEITLFNRGVSNPGLFAGIESLHGDRNDGFAPLSGRRWDAVIDVAPYFPRQVRLASTIDAAHYTLISTISVFADFSEVGLTEQSPVGTLDDPESESAHPSAYGPLKALCEQAALEATGGKALVLRPGLIVGPFDPTGRFTYWPWRIAAGGEVLVPDGPHVPVQVIDARDLAEWTIRMIEAGASGTYNATGPSAPLTLGGVFEVCRGASHSPSTLTWVPEPFLLEQSVSPWTQMPLWVGNNPAMAGFARVDVTKAMAAGLTYRPIAETVRDTLRWALAESAPPLAGISREREATVLALWHTRAGHHDG